jgi:acyl-CoA thioesterase
MPINKINNIEKALEIAAKTEPFALKMGIKCEEVGEGSARTSMTVEEGMLNLFGMAHGGAIFSLMDDAFQLACNSRGKTAYALNVSTVFIKGAQVGDKLTAVASEVSLTHRTGTYELKVKNGEGELIATAQAVAYRKKEAPPFL